MSDDVRAALSRSKSEKQSESYFLKRGKRVLGPLAWEQVGNFVNSEKAQKGDLVATSANGPYTLLIDAWKSKGTSQKLDEQRAQTGSVEGQAGKPEHSKGTNDEWYTCPKCGSRIKAKNKSRHENRCDANQQTQSRTEPRKLSQAEHRKIKKATEGLTKTKQNPKLEKYRKQAMKEIAAGSQYVPSLKEDDPELIDIVCEKLMRREENEQNRKANERKKRKKRRENFFKQLHWKALLNLLVDKVHSDPMLLPISLLKVAVTAAVLLPAGWVVYQFAEAIFGDLDVGGFLSGISWAKLSLIAGLLLTVGLPLTIFPAFVALGPIFLVLVVIADNTSDGKVSEQFFSVIIFCFLTGVALLLASGPIWVAEWLFR